MAIYVYHCYQCLQDKERNVRIAERDEQKCESCGRYLHRKVRFTGSVWSPTSNGGMKR